MDVWMYGCMDVCVAVCMYVCMDGWMYVCMLFVCLFVCMYVEGVCMYVMDGAGVYACMHACMCVCGLCPFLTSCCALCSVKFWKKKPLGIEFVKQFRAHGAAITSVSVTGTTRTHTHTHTLTHTRTHARTVIEMGASAEDGLYFASAGADKTVKVFDVVNFDLIQM